MLTQEQRDRYQRDGYIVIPACAGSRCRTEAMTY